MTKIANEIEALIAARNKAQNKHPKQDVQIKPEPTTVLKSSNNTEIPNVLEGRDECIRNLHAAKVSHKKWMSFVQILIRLGDVDEARISIPINYAMCEFGKWYYGKGSKLIVFSEFIQIENNHKNIHDIYLQIFKLYDHKIKGSLFKSTKKLIDQRRQKAIDLSKLMEQCSKVMFDLLLHIETELKRMSQKQLEKLFLSSITEK